MEPTLDEASIVPCLVAGPAVRIQRLADTLKALDALGARRVLRSVRGAADRDIGDGRGLRGWCFDRASPRDAGLFVAGRLDKAPYVDGTDGLFAAVEGERVVEASIAGIRSLGGGYVALTDGLLVLLAGSAWPPARPVVVRLDVLTDDGEQSDDVVVDAADSPAEIVALRDLITSKIESAADSGIALVEQLPELCPHLVLGTKAIEHLLSLSGSEPYFRQVIRHLRALNRAADTWVAGVRFEPDGVTFSGESEATLRHGSLGPLRDFPTPADFSPERWTLHTKLTGGNGARIYYKMQEFEDPQPTGAPVRRLRVAVGYVGPHLRTVKFQ